MKKRVLSIVLVIVLLVTMTGCGEKKNTDTSQAQGDAQGVKNANTDATIPNSAFQIALNGDNEAVFTLNHEAVGKLESIQNGDSSEIKNEIYIDLFSDNSEDYLTIIIREGNFYICEGSSAEEYWFYDSSNDSHIQPEWDGNTVSATISHVGIADVVNKYANYRVVLFDIKGGANETLEEGNVADILINSDVQTTDSLKIVSYDDNIVKFKVYGEEAKSAFYNNKKISIKLYESSEQQNEGNKIPTIEFQHTQLNMNTGRGRVVAFTYTNEDNMVTGHELSGDETNYNSVSVASDYGVAMKYESDGLSGLIGNTLIYEVYFDNDLMCVGNVNDSLIEKEKEYSINPLPEAFPISNKDSDLFVPETDNYHVIMMEVPYLIDIPVWYERMGILVYGSNKYREAEQHVATVVMLESYDEFGLNNVKTKIIYEDYVQSLYAGTDSGNIILEPVPQIFEPDDNLITEKLLDDFSRFDLYENTFSQHWYTYHGRFDNIKYFEESFNALEAYDAKPMIIPITYSNDNAWYTNQQQVSIFDDLQFESGTIKESTATIYADYVSTHDAVDFEYKINTYSTNEKVSYENNIEQYNTAPGNWHDHPYASLLPELPQGMTVNYTPVSDEVLHMGSDVNGCTREQALEFIGKMRKIEYTKIYADVENDEEIIYSIEIDNGIGIGASWSNDNQQIAIFAQKD